MDGHRASPRFRDRGEPVMAGKPSHPLPKSYFPYNLQYPSYLVAPSRTGVGPWNLPYIDCVCRLGLARGVINMAGRYQGFHSLNTGNIEIFWRADGWCWWSRAPGCHSESAPVGPFLTSTDAYLNANGGACLIPRPARLDRVA